MDTGGAPSQSTMSGRRPGGWGRRVALAALVAIWVLLTWRAIQPPVRIRLPAFEPEGMVLLGGGAIPASSGLKGADVAPFRMDRFEVTEGDFAEFLGANPDEPAPYHWLPPDVPGAGQRREPPPGTEEFPVVHVDLHQARRYAAWRGAHIPTVEEWEWAALGAQGDAFPWGIDAAVIRANTQEAGFEGRTPVGFFPAGVARGSGCYGMVGNVTEWTDSPARYGDDRFFVRGGSYRDPLVGILNTHAPGSRLVQRENRVIEPQSAPPFEQEVPIDDRLEPPGSHSSILGFRCAMNEAEYGRQRDAWARVEELVYDLAHRDLVSGFWLVRPAKRELVEIGYFALRPLGMARRQVADDAVRANIDEVVAAIERKVGLR